MSRSPHNTPGPRHGPAELQPIQADTLYPWAALFDSLGWGAEAIAEARRRGLRVLRFARRQYVLGRDVIRFLESVADQDGPDVAENGRKRQTGAMVQDSL